METRLHHLLTPLSSAIYYIDLTFLFVVFVFLYADGSDFVRKKKSKKMRYRREDNFPTVTENKKQRQDSVESNTANQLSEHHTVVETNKHVQSTAKLTNSQKHTDSKGNKTHSVIPDGVSSSEYDDASNIEGQHQKVKDENVASSDTDHHAHSQRDQHLEPFSGIKDVLIPSSMVCDTLVFIRQLSDICLITLMLYDIMNIHAVWKR